MQTNQKVVSDEYIQKYFQTILQHFGNYLNPRERLGEANQNITDRVLHSQGVFAYFPCALSPESITASAPSYTAFVTSLTSALSKTCNVRQYNPKRRMNERTSDLMLSIGQTGEEG